MSEELDSRPTFGFVRRKYDRVVACVRCGRRVSSGIVNHRDYEIPPRNLICEGCYEDIRVTTLPEDPFPDD